MSIRTRPSSASSKRRPSSSSLSSSSSPVLVNSLVHHSRTIDNDDLSNQIRQLKEQYTLLISDNTILRTKLSKAESSLRKKDKQIQQIVNMKMLGATGGGGGGGSDGMDVILAGQLKEFKSEWMNIQKLTEKIKELEIENSKKDQEIKKFKQTMKCTLIRELEIEAQTYYNEARKLKKALDMMMTTQQHNTPSHHYHHNNQQQHSHDARCSMTHNNHESIQEINNRNEQKNIDIKTRQENADLRSELNTLRSENLRLRSELSKQSEGYHKLNTLRNKMTHLSHELIHCQQHLAFMDHNQLDATKNANDNNDNKKKNTKKDNALLSIQNDRDISLNADPKANAPTSKHGHSELLVVNRYLSDSEDDKWNEGSNSMSTSKDGASPMKHQHHDRDALSYKEHAATAVVDPTWKATENVSTDTHATAASSHEFTYISDEDQDLWQPLQQSEYEKNPIADLPQDFDNY